VILPDLILDEAISIHVEDIENNRMLSLYGAELVDDGDTILTHCNAGALRNWRVRNCLGVIRAAYEAGKKIKVIATETRPYLQGARLYRMGASTKKGSTLHLYPITTWGFSATAEG